LISVALEIEFVNSVPSSTRSQDLPKLSFEKRLALKTLLFVFGVDATNEP